MLSHSRFSVPQLSKGILLLLAVACQPVSADIIGVPDGVAPGEKYHRIFVTSTTFRISSDPIYPPDTQAINGLRGADWQATFTAFVAGHVSNDDWVAFNSPTNPIEAPYKALLSDSQHDARDRISIEGKVFNMQNELIAVSLDDLFDGTIVNAVQYDEFGEEVRASVWSGTTALGNHSGESCGDWMDPSNAITIGNTSGSGPIWIQAGSASCTFQRRFYAISSAQIAAVPEPSSMTLLATACLAATFRRRRRR